MVAWLIAILLAVGTGHWPGVGDVPDGTYEFYRPLAMYFPCSYYFGDDCVDGFGRIDGSIWRTAEPGTVHFTIITTHVVPPPSPAFEEGFGVPIEQTSRCLRDVSCPDTTKACRISYAVVCTPSQPAFGQEEPSWGWAPGCDLEFVDVVKPGDEHLPWQEREIIKSSVWRTECLDEVPEGVE